MKVKEQDPLAVVLLLAIVLLLQKLDLLPLYLFPKIIFREVVSII